MAFFPRSLVSEPTSSSLTPFFRFLDDFENHHNPSRTHDHTNNKAQRFSNIMTTFNPKFDIRELADAYELHGELPGVDQNNIDIEFTDAQTLRISGRIERSYRSGPSNSTSLEALKSTAAIENSRSSPQKASVQDEEEGTAETDGSQDKSAGAEEKSREDQAKVKEDSSESGEVATKAKETSKEPEAKLWVSERSIGEFSRSFSFPLRVDQDTVKASMKNGILSVAIPKAKQHQIRKITIT